MAGGSRHIIKVLHVNSSAGVGGGERLLEQMAQGLGGEFAFSFALPEGPFRTTLSNRYPCYPIDLSRRFSLQTYRCLLDILREGQFSIVHSHGARAGFVTRLAARRVKVGAVVSTIHNSVRDYPYSRPKRLLYARLEKWTGHNIARYVAVSESIRRDLVEFYSFQQDRVSVIHNGIDVESWTSPLSQNQARQHFSFDQDRFIVGLIGRLTNQKGHRYLIDAVKAIPEVYLVLAGGGPDEEALQDQVIRAGLSDRVCFLGNCSEIPQLLAAIDVYALPSLSEGFSIGLLEAMASGCTIMATSIAPVREAIDSGREGILVPPRDVEALRSTLEVLHSNPELRADLGAAARFRVSRDFTLSRTLDQYKSLYLQVLNRKAGGIAGTDQGTDANRDDA